MTIKEAARKHGVSTQAIYQRLKKAGVDLTTIKDSNTGVLTETGVRLIDNMFTNHAEKVEQHSSARLQVETAVNLVNQQLEQAVRERDALRADVSRLEAELRGERDLRAAIERERDTLRQALDQSQQLQALTLARIPEPRQPLWRRLFERKRISDGGTTAE